MDRDPRPPAEQGGKPLCGNSVVDCGSLRDTARKLQQSGKEGNGKRSQSETAKQLPKYTAQRRKKDDIGADIQHSGCGRGDRAGKSVIPLR